MPVYVSSTCAHHQEVKIALHSLWYHHTYRRLSRARKFCASSWLITEINILRWTVSRTSKNTHSSFKLFIPCITMQYMYKF